MNYLQFSNLKSSLINDKTINDFLFLAKKDKRINSIKYNCKINEKHYFKVNALIDNEKICKEMTLGQISNLLNETNLERKQRLIKEQENEIKQLKVLSDIKKNLLNKFVEIANNNKTSFEDLCFYHDTIFSGRAANFQSKKWKSAEKTFSDFNDFQNILHLDVNFFRRNFEELSQLI